MNRKQWLEYMLAAVRRRYEIHGLPFNPQLICREVVTLFRPGLPHPCPDGSADVYLPGQTEAALEAELLLMWNGLNKSTMTAKETP